MKKIVSKTLIICGGVLSIIGMFPVVGLYPTKMWESPNAYWNYMFFSRSEYLWKLALIILLLGILISFIVKNTNRMKILIFNILGIIMSFITAFVGINKLIPSSSIILYPISVALFIIAIICSFKSPSIIIFKKDELKELL